MGSAQAAVVCPAVRGLLSRPLLSARHQRQGKSLVIDQARALTARFRLGPCCTADLVEQRSNLSFRVSAVTAKRPHRGELPVLSPSRHGLGVNAEHGCYLCWGEQPGELW